MTQEERVSAMYEMYVAGLSLAQVGDRFSVTRQSVYKMFASRGLALRKKKRLDFVTFNGCKYTMNRHGYYRRTTHGRGKALLHQDVWEFHNGTIPVGYDIHHKDIGDCLLQ